MVKPNVMSDSYETNHLCQQNGLCSGKIQNALLRHTYPLWSEDSRPSSPHASCSCIIVCMTARECDKYNVGLVCPDEHVRIIFYIHQHHMAQEHRMQHVISVCVSLCLAYTSVCYGLTEVGETTTHGKRLEYALHCHDPLCSRIFTFQHALLHHKPRC
jgi:hypothetical protein